MRDLAGGAFLAQQRNLVLIGGTGTGKRHVAVGLARACIRGGASGRFFNVVDLVDKLEAEARAGSRGRIAVHSAAWTSSSSMSEVIRRTAPWRSLEAIEFATLGWVDWFNNRRLLESVGNIPPAEAEARFFAELDTVAMAAQEQTNRSPANPVRFRYPVGRPVADFPPPLTGLIFGPTGAAVALTHK